MYSRTEDLSARELYKLLIGCVVPRPIAWISSRSDDGVLNLAPFSFYNAFSVDPPVVGVGIGSRRVREADGSTRVMPKDTCRNIIDTGEFVVNVVSRQLAGKMNQSSAEYESAEDEFQMVGLTPQPSIVVRPPRVGECSISMECKLYQRIEIGSTNLILGEILVLHWQDGVIENNEVDLEILEAVGRMSGNTYCETTARFDIERPAPP